MTQVIKCIKSVIFITLICWFIFSPQIIGFSLPTPPQPFPVFGTVYNYNLVPIDSAANVTLINGRTLKSLSQLTGTAPGTTEPSQFLFDLKNIPSGFIDGDPLILEATFNNQTGSKTNLYVNETQGNLQADIILAQSSYPYYRLWGYCYFDENKSLIENTRIPIEITNIRTNGSASLLSSILGRFQYDISQIPVGYIDRDNFTLKSAFGIWNSSARVTIDLTNDPRESKVDLYFFLNTVTSTISTTPTQGRNTAFGLDFQVIIALIVLLDLRLRCKKE